MTKHGAGEVTHGPNNDPPAFLMGQRDSHTHARGGTADDFLDRYAALPSAARNSDGVRPPSASLRLSVL